MFSAQDIEVLETKFYGDLRLTPLFFPQRKLRAKDYLPRLVDLPADLKPYFMGAGWGLYGPYPGLAALDTQNQILQVKYPSFLWAITGVTNDTTGAGGTSQGFNFNVYHTHNGNQYRFANRHVFNGEMLGGAIGRPLILRKPHLFLPGDSVEIEVKNLGTPVAPAVTSIKVTLIVGQMVPESEIPSGIGPHPGRPQ